MTVISNTSPLNYLALIGLQDILPALFGRVLIPEAVWHELSSSGAPRLGILHKESDRWKAVSTK